MYDMKVLKRLDDVHDLLVQTVKTLCENITSAENCTADSVMQVGMKSRQILDEIYEMIDEV